MATAVSINISMPRGDMSFIRQLGKRMGWTISQAKRLDALYDPETKSYLNEETMQAIRDVGNQGCVVVSYWNSFGFVQEMRYTDSPPNLQPCRRFDGFLVYIAT